MNKKESYAEFCKRTQEETNALPMYWAYSNEQWNRLLEKLGINENEVGKKLRRGPAGCFIRVEDVDTVVSTFKRHDEEREELMKDMEFFKEAVIYEMKNHEYHINWQGDWDVCNALGFDCKCEYEDIRDIDSTDMTVEQKKTYLEARREFFKYAEENDWY